MVPPKTDPKWEKLVKDPKSLPVTGLATKVLMTRLMLMNCATNTGRTKEAIDAAYDFFVKNETAAKDDIKLIFGWRENFCYEINRCCENNAHQEINDNDRGGVGINQERSQTEARAFGAAALVFKGQGRQFLHNRHRIEVVVLGSQLLKLAGMGLAPGCA